MKTSNKKSGLPANDHLEALEDLNFDPRDRCYLMRCCECERVLFQDDLRCVVTKEGEMEDACPHCKDTAGLTWINPDGRQVREGKPWRGVSREVMIALNPALAIRIGFGVDQPKKAVYHGLVIGGAE